MEGAIEEIETSLLSQLAAALHFDIYQRVPTSRSMSIPSILLCVVYETTRLK